MSSESKQRVIPKGQLAKIFAVPVFMFGFGFALVPLYDIYCEITGQNGKTGEIEISMVDEALIDEDRLIEVRFLANTRQGLPWEFEPIVEKMMVHPGKVYEAPFKVRNSADVKTFGQAVPSVSPTQAAAHFNKTECFCFTQQELDAKESREMPMQFVVGPNIADDVEQITLSYTFFSMEQQEQG